jgi:hypothetical protein
MPYADWLTRLMPTWLQGAWGAALIEAIGEELDECNDELIQARKASMPTQVATTPAADKALAEIGFERQLERGPVETAVAYGERLRLAWDVFLRMGSHGALLGQLDIAGYDRPNLYVIQRSGRRSTRTGLGVTTFANGPVWTWSGKPPEAYAEFGLLFTVAQPSLTWDPVTGIFSAAAAKLNRIAWRWRPGKADFMGTVIIASGATWGWPTTRTWGAFNWGGTGSFIPPR